MRYKNELRKYFKKIEKDAFSQRDKGARFEILIKNWFLSAPIYCNDIKEIWLWNEFPYKEQFGGSDSGIDLIILTNENEYWAIQCKFYSSDKYIDKADVDTFISTSSKFFKISGIKTKFSSRLFVSTTNKWSKKANELIENQEIPVVRISLTSLEDSGVDWEKLYLGNVGKEARKEKNK